MPLPVCRRALLDLEITTTLPECEQLQAWEVHKCEILAGVLIFGS